MIKPGFYPVSVSQQVVLHLKALFSQTGEESLDQKDTAQVNSKQISIYNHLLNTRPPSRSPIVTFVSNENNFKNANGKKLPFLVKGPFICKANSGFSKASCPKYSQKMDVQILFHVSCASFLHCPLPLPQPSFWIHNWINKFCGSNTFLLHQGGEEGF